MKYILDVPENQEQDLRRYLDTHDISILRKAEDMAVMAIEDGDIENDVDIYMKENPVLGKYYTSEQLTQSIMKNLQHELEAEERNDDTAELIRQCLEDTLFVKVAAANRLEDFCNNHYVSEEDVEKAKRYILDEHVQEPRYYAEKILNILGTSEFLSLKPDRDLAFALLDPDEKKISPEEQAELAVSYNLYHMTDLCKIADSVNSGCKSAFLTAPHEVPSITFGREFFHYIEEQYEVPDLENEKNKASMAVHGLNYFAQNMQDIVNGMSECRDEASASDRLISSTIAYLDAARLFQDHLPSKLSKEIQLFRTDFSEEEIPDFLKETYRKGVKTLNILRGREMPQQPESPAAEMMRNVYSCRGNLDLIRYDRLDKMVVENLMPPNSSRKDVKKMTSAIQEIASIAKRIQPQIDEKVYAKRLEKAAYCKVENQQSR